MVMEIRNFVRAWLAFTALQLIGNLWQCTQMKTFSAVLLRKGAVTDVATIAALFFVHYCTMLLLRLFIIYYFDCIPLQIFHVVCTTISTVFLVFEAFYAQVLDKSSALYIQIALSGATVLLMLSTWRFIFVVTEKLEKLEKKKRRKLTAVQMMEHDYLNFKKQE